jgi:hypothetical protein
MLNRVFRVSQKGIDRTREDPCNASLPVDRQPMATLIHRPNEPGVVADN